MKLLLHTCCGPCTLYPVTSLRKNNINIWAYFFNPNIHPYLEYERRAHAMLEVAEKLSLPVIWDDARYNLDAWLKFIDNKWSKEERCPLCYEMRLQALALTAAKYGFDTISTTLLYSKYQQHNLIKEMGEKIAAASGLTFYYEDFRKGWQKGIDISIKLGIYRQPYCGCIFSEKERYEKRAARLAKKLIQEGL